MEQRQPRLGDILDDYCPRERRLTNHAVVAMIGSLVKQTRCTTCDAEHEYKHAKVPRQRRKSDTPTALYAQVLAGGPKRIAHDSPVDADSASNGSAPAAGEPGAPEAASPEIEYGAGAIESEREPGDAAVSDDENKRDEDEREEGPVHRPLIRASLPRPEGQSSPARPAPEFTIRQPGGRQNRFHPRHARGAQFQTNRSNGNMGGLPPRGGAPRQGGGRPPQGTMTSRLIRRNGPGRKRSK